MEQDLGPDRGFDWTTVDQQRRQDIVYNLALLEEAGFIHAAIRRFGSSGPHPRDVVPFALTWQGHEYLDTIRDPEVWRKTKQAAAAGGGFSLKVLASVATALATEAALRAVNLK